LAESCYDDAARSEQAAIMNLFGVRSSMAALATFAVLTFTARAMSQATPSAAVAVTAPWMNATLPADQRADLLLAQMSQDEQLQLVLGYLGVNVMGPYGRRPPDYLKTVLPGTAGYVPGIPRLGIPSLIASDAGLGIANGGHLRPGDEATALPSGLATAATWDPEIAQSTGVMLGAEARDRAFNVVLAGAMNLAREPRSGRTFEYAGEDPLLAGVIVGAEVAGIQSQHVLSTVKHFALNDQETGRLRLNANIGVAAARESDLLAFEIAIERGHPGAVMCAYNRYNGTYACENDPLLNGVLKGDWKYPGWVLSDWGAVHSTVEAANGGLDQESASGQDSREFFGAPLRQALADGQVSPARLHDMVHRILRSMFAGGLFDFPAAKRSPDAEAHRAIARRDAEEAIVLLKNNGMLPLSRSLRSIAVIGAHADVGVLSGGGSSQVIPIGHSATDEFPITGSVQILPDGSKIVPGGTEIYDPPSPLAAIRAAAANAVVTFTSGDDAAAAADMARQADVVVVFARQWMSEGRDVPNLELPGDQDALIAAVASANPRTVVVLETGGPVLMPWLDQVGAVLEAWYAGSGGATAIQRVLFGEVNPSGRLPVTFPTAEEQLPHPVISNSIARLAPFDVDYFEGAEVGYRWFQMKNEKPLFPFGYGLSYTTYRIGPSVAVAADASSASVSVINTGTVAGSETVQVYGAAVAPEGPGTRRLIGWAKVPLRPGESKQVTIALDLRPIAAFDEQRHAWKLGGNYLVAVATSSQTIPATATIALPSHELSP